MYLNTHLNLKRPHVLFQVSEWTPLPTVFNVADNICQRHTHRIIPMCIEFLNKQLNYTKLGKTKGFTSLFKLEVNCGECVNLNELGEMCVCVPGERAHSLER